LAWKSKTPGSFPLGMVELTVAVGDVAGSSGAKGGAAAASSSSAAAAAAAGVVVQTLRLPLPFVTVAASAVRCDVGWPDAAVARQPVQVSVRVTNATPHFHALEVSLQPPAAAVVTAPGQIMTGTATQSGLDAIALSGVPAFEPLDRFTRYIVELLPGASKAVSFNLVAQSPGFAALPSVVVKATRTEGRPEARVAPPGAVPRVMATSAAPSGTVPGIAPATAAGPPTTLAPVAPPAPPGSEVMAVLPVGPDGVPAPRGIFVTLPTEPVQAVSA
jgi:hypothetical protein